ncbi:MAG: thioredoxin family protein [Luteibacter sp.]|uniref:thioredoxin family protein n=1 Tax=Rhodanobacteraceae TaxID=1775411 RepID=UPI00087FBD19|nr:MULTISPECIES: thioredoxin family protein [Rhodanobacteraceae]MDQ7997960.1 thioredoxin family protein [Luteibacter sp.]MDQ8050521.1 thioredoxin family protein [Luteibacter sp.]SDF37907.1 Thiol-disulfide isomerase or thioredoxin [Dyella sp. 333MFSha]SKB28341.1 Thiol-disulfide isomerase or thioredoxin [Luteibacter sp. 22Crub2.1]
MRQLRHTFFALLVALTAFAAATPAMAAQTAPEFAGIANWQNSRPLTMKSLRGKVVLIDFWAYSCINCLRTLPHVTRWYDQYKDKGLVIVGVHSPEFAFEKQDGNVRDAIAKYNIKYPVAQDNDLETWDAWDNQYWPAEYLVDQRGNVIAHHFGEGNYAEMENAIRTLLGLPRLEATAEADKDAPDFTQLGSPEMYFGSDRAKNNASPGGDSAGTRDFTAPSRLELNQFALIGKWEIGRQNATLVGANGEIRLHFKAKKVHMVASANDAVTLEIAVDGKPMAPVTVQKSQLYTLFDGDGYKDHVLTIKIPKGGFHAFTFTFG